MAEGQAQAGVDQVDGWPCSLYQYRENLGAQQAELLKLQL